MALIEAGVPPPSPFDGIAAIDPARSLPLQAKPAQRETVATSQLRPHDPADAEELSYSPREAAGGGGAIQRTALRAL